MESKGPVTFPAIAVLGPIIVLMPDLKSAQENLPVKTILLSTFLPKTAIEGNVTYPFIISLVFAQNFYYIDLK